MGLRWGRARPRPPPAPRCRSSLDETSNIQQKVPVSIQDELRTSYLDYAMSVIIGRAIPDVRDGLKPVHRRILYSMYEQKIGPTAARVQEVRARRRRRARQVPPARRSSGLRRARPMGQPFSLRYPLVDGQGNYGSVDGDSPAAMRYTESRLSRMAVELLADLDKETVDLVPNFDDSELEPSVLPAKFPQLLVNGSGGIAVGMATNIPPHNLGEIIDATDRHHPQPRRHPGGAAPPSSRAPISRPAASSTARAASMQAQRDRPRLDHHARAPPGREDAGKGDREQIVVTEIPYQVNKARLVAKIAECMKREAHRGHQRGARRERPRGHAHRHRAEEGHLPAGGPQPALPADRPAGDVRRHQPVDRERPPGGARA